MFEIFTQGLLLGLAVIPLLLARLFAGLALAGKRRPASETLEGPPRIRRLLNRL